MVMSGRYVNLPTLFLGRLRPPKRLTSTLCTYFRQKLTTALLESAVVAVVVALLFYVHGKHLRSCRDGQLTKPHFWKEKRKYVAGLGIELGNSGS